MALCIAALGFGCMPSGIGLVAVDLGAGSAGDGADTFAVDVELEAVIAGSNRDDLPGVDHADMDPLRGDHDGAALRYAPLHDDWTGCRRWARGGSSGSAEPVPVTGRDRAWHCAKERAVVADDSHLSAIHPQCDALSGQVEADIDLVSAQTSKSHAVNSPIDLDSRSCPARRRRGPGRARTVSCQPGQLDETRPRGQRLEPDAINEHMEGFLIHPDGDLPSRQSGTEPDLLAADPQVP